MRHRTGKKRVFLSYYRKVLSMWKHVSKKRSFLSAHQRSQRAFLLLFAILVTGVLGCARKEEKENLTVTGFAFDTMYTITLYQGGSQEVLDSCVERCSGYEEIFSRTLPESELYQINELEQIYSEIIMSEEYLQGKQKAAGLEEKYTQEEIADITGRIGQQRPEKNIADFTLRADGGMEFTVSDMLCDILQTGQRYSEASKGNFDITIAPVTSLWDFKTENPEVPDERVIKEALTYVDYRKLSIKGNSLCIMQPGQKIDLGGIAKGYIADDLKRYLQEQGVSGATINLGGNVLCIGEKNDGEAFRIGIQQPFADRNETAAVVGIKNLSVVSSGIYERYFRTKDGELYHHIINPKTGYPFENDLYGVTILSANSVDGDALSTTCFALGKEKGMEYINSLEDVYALFITSDGRLWYSEGFEAYVLE